MAAVGLGAFAWAVELARGQAQIQGDERSLARRILIDDGFQMHQFRPEDMKPLLDFLDLVADFFFDVGSFVDLVADVNVHFRASNAGKSPRKRRSLTRRLYTRWEGAKSAFGEWPVVKVEFVAGHRFSDASTSAKSVTPLAACGKLDVALDLGWSSASALPCFLCRTKGGAQPQIAITQNGQTLAAATEDEMVREWDMPSGKEQHVDNCHRARVWALAMTTDEKCLFSAGGDGLGRRWELASGAQLSPFANHGAIIRGIAISPNGNVVSSIGDDGSIQFSDCRTGASLDRIKVGDDRLYFLAYCMRGTSVALFTENGHLREFDVKSKREVRKYFCGKEVNCVAYSPIDDYAVILKVPDPSPECNESTVIMIDLSNCERMQYFNDFREEFTTGIISKDGRFLALARSGRTEKPILVYELSTGSPIAEIGGLHAGASPTITTLHFLPISRFLALGTNDSKIEIVDIFTRKSMCHFDGLCGSILAVECTSDCKFLLTGNSDSTVLKWKLPFEAKSNEFPSVRSQANLSENWELLASQDAKRGYVAVSKFVGGGNEGTSFLRDRLRPIAKVNYRQIRKCIDELKSSEFRVRENGQSKLIEFGDVAESILRESLNVSESAEVRARITTVLRAIGPFGSERIRKIRAIYALELIDSAESRATLEVLSNGAPESRITKEAQLSLGRLRIRKAEEQIAPK